MLLPLTSFTPQNRPVPPVIAPPDIPASALVMRVLLTLIFTPLNYPLPPLAALPDVPASALAMRVLPVPGSPSNRMPLGGRAPKLEKDLGSFKNCEKSREEVQE